MDLLHQRPAAQQQRPARGEAVRGEAGEDPVDGHRRRFEAEVVDVQGHGGGRIAQAIAHLVPGGRVLQPQPGAGIHLHL